MRGEIRKESGTLRQFKAMVESGEVEAGGLGGSLRGGGGSEMHQFTLRGRANGGGVIRLGIFASLGGGGVFGGEAMLRLARLAQREVELVGGYKLQFHLFSGGEEPVERGALGLTGGELGLLRREIAGNMFHGIIILYANEEGEGVLGHARSAVIYEELLVPALSAATRAMGVREEAVVFGRRESLLTEGIGRRLPFEIGLGMPVGAAFESKVAGALEALEEILRCYRTMLAQGNDI